MPRTGGEADKFGNRYESLWAVDAVLDLITGDYLALTFEPIRDEAAGIEFFGTRPEGIREYHSIKRQQSEGNWTVSRLTQQQGSTGRSILGDLVEKIAQGAEGVFSSGTSASELEEMSDRAKSSSSIEEFRSRVKSNDRLSGHFTTRINSLCNGDETAAYQALKRLHVRTKNESELRKDVERRIRSMFRAGTGGPIDATTAHLLVADFLIDSLGQTLTASPIHAYLAGHGILPSQLADNDGVAQRIRQLNRL